MVPIGSPLPGQSVTRGQELEFSKIGKGRKDRMESVLAMGPSRTSQSCSHFSGKSGSPSPYQVIVPTGKVELLKLPSGVPLGFFSTENQSGGAAAPATQY